MAPKPQLEKVRELFLEVHDLPSQRRAEILAEKCAGDSALRREVEALFVADQDSSAFPTSTQNTAPGGFLPAASVPGYRIHRTLGDGGQGIVYLATQLTTGRRVALKVLKALAHGSPKVFARFEREIKVLAALDHPNVVSIVDRGVLPDGSPFLVMDYIDGVSLAAWITTKSAEKEAIAPANALPMFITICDAVNAAHLRGITHRDLKPANILIDERDQPHIVDFGLAHTLMISDSGASVDPISLTGQFMGSLPWASPEQANGQVQKIDTRSDVYSLGVMLYQLLTGGRFPYQVAGTMREVLDNILTAQPPPPSGVVSAEMSRNERRDRRHRSTGVNRELDAIVLKALAKSRGDRYQTAGELGRDLEYYLAGRPCSASAEARSTRTLKYSKVLAAIIVGMVVLASAGYGFVRLSALRKNPVKAMVPQTAATLETAVTPTDPSMPAPLLHWSFDNPGSLTQAVLEKRTIDAGHDGVDAIAGPVGGAIHVKPNGYFNLADRPQFHLKTAVTISAWILLPVNPKGYAYVLSKTYAPDAYSLFVDDSNVGFSISRPGGQWGQSFDVHSQIKPGEWTCVAGCYDGHQIQLFVGGQLADAKQVVDIAKPAGAMQDSGMPLRCGFGVAEFSVDELSLYNVALSDGQISQLAGNSSSVRPLFDDLSIGAKITELQKQVAASPTFDFKAHNSLRHLYLVSQNDPRRGMEEVDIIFKNSPMNDYMLNTLRDWNAEPGPAIKSLLKHSQPYPDLLFLSAACWTRACELESDPGRAAKLAGEVAKLPGPEFDLYRDHVTQHLKSLEASRAPTTQQAVNDDSH